jgi:SagB-type dehydrogenase family enzyme
MVTEHFTLRGDTKAVFAEDGEVRLIGHHGVGISLGILTRGQSAAIRALSEAELDPAELVARTTGVDGQAGLAQAYTLLRALRAGNWLRIGLATGKRRLLTLIPCAAPGTASAMRRTASLTASGGGPAVQGPEEPRLLLSRFAVLRRVGIELVLESPRTGVSAHVADPEVAAVLARLARPFPRADATTVAPWAAEVLDVLVTPGLVVAENSPEETEFRYLQWAPHELWFHMRSGSSEGPAESGGAGGRPWGGTRWAKGRFPAPAARGDRARGPRNPLPVPDLGLLAASDPAFADVVEARRSIREHHDERPITREELGEFLYRTARTRTVRRTGEVEVLDRPYPSGGALHELQMYVVTAGVAGIEPGLHRYDGWEHALEGVAPYGPEVRAIARRAAAAVGTADTPQVVLVLTARFGRVMWKYQSMAYALVLKNTGVLIASMYLAAAAMRLAPCAMGNPEADLFWRATGIDPLIESAVGGFTLGSARPGSYTRDSKEE